MNEPRPADVDELIAEFLLAAERGHAPDVADWLARHPEQAATLAAFLADYGRFEAFLGASRPADLGRTVDFHGPATNADGRPLGGYELLGEVGHGGMGVVYRARLLGTTLVVALKLIRGTEGGQAISRFREEIESAAGLRHPNIVPVYHVGEHDGRPFYTMALIEGGSLDRHLSRYQGDHEATASLLVKLARAVHFAHQRQILHRDLKPANILLDATGEPHVADFGLAARLGETGTASGSPGGSLPWMAPEAVRGDATLTTAVDVWALGVILYELLTGERPFRGATWREVRDAILKSDPPPPRALNRRIPRDLDAICLRCLAKDPERRYESASAVALEMERWLRGESVRARPVGGVERVARWCGRRPMLAGAVAVSAALLVAITGVAVSITGEVSERLARAVCQINETSARQVAVIVQNRLDSIGKAVLDTAANSQLSAACRANDSAVAANELRRLHGAAGGRVKNAFVLDEKGVLRFTSDPRVPVDVVGKAFPGRDYFTGAKKGRPGEVHVSRAFKSEDDQLDKLAVSVAFWPFPNGQPWVLAATVTTDATVGQNGLPTDALKVVLLAPVDDVPPRPDAPAQPPGFVIMAHPAFGPGERTQRLLDGLPSASELRYTDPVGAIHPEYDGRWLAGSAPVANSELVVLVQQRYDEAVAPHEGDFRRFLALVGGVVAIGLAALAALRMFRGMPRQSGG